MSLHIVILNYSYEKQLDVEALLARYFLLTGWAEGVYEAGGRITVLQRYKHDLTFERNGVTYCCVADGFGETLRHRDIPLNLHRHSALATAHVAHLNGLIFPLQTLALRLKLPRTCPIVAQHHGELPRTGLQGLAQRVGLRWADDFIFTTEGIAQDWRARGMIRKHQTTHEVLEGSSRFKPGDKARAQAETGLMGAPVVVWAGRLDENKDPLTVLNGFEQALTHKPAMRLYIAHRGDGLLQAVQDRIERSPLLREAVRLLGHVPHTQMEALYQSADYFVLGSHHEGSGISLVEALACGVVPVVTHIPPFFSITKSGAVGRLWVPSNADDFARALLEVQQQPHNKLSAAVTEHFASALSFEAIGRKALQAYETAYARKQS